MPITWNTESMYILACKVLEHSGGIPKVDYDKIAATWPGNPSDRPGVPTLKKQITVLRKVVSGDASPSAPRSTTKPASRLPPKTPTKRSAPAPKTPASKKRKVATSKHKPETDESEILDLTSSDEDTNNKETTDDEGIDVTPKNRRILPTRPRSAKSQSYAEESDSDGKDAGARSDSDGDDDFDPRREGSAEKDLPPKKTNFSALLAKVDADVSDDDEEENKRVPVGDDAKSIATSHTSFKSAREDMGDDDEDEDGY